MNQKDKKTNDELNMKDVSNSDNINYVNGKNASVTNDSFVIKDLSFEDFKFDAKVKDGDASFEETEEKASSNNNDDNNKSTDNKDSEKSDNNKSDDMQDISDNDSSNNNDMQDVSDNDNADNSDENNSNEDKTDENNSNEDKTDEDNAGDSSDGSGNEKNDNQTDEKNNEDKDKNPQSPDEEKKDDKESDDKKDKDDKESDDKKNKDDNNSDKESEDKKDKDSKNEKDDKKDDKGSDNKKDNNGLDDKKNNDDKKENNDPNKKNNDQNKNNNNQNTNDKNKPAKDDKNNDTNKDKKDNKDNKKDKNKKSNNDNKRPNPYQRKKDDLKNKWNNRPKNFNDVKNRAKSGLKNKGKDALNNSAPGRAVNNAKQKINDVKETVKILKKAFKGLLNLLKFLFTPPILFVTLIVIVLLVMMLLIVSFDFPGVDGDVNKDGTIEKYSEVDQKSIEKVKNLVNNYPNADGALAMAIVAYPFHNSLQNSIVRGFLTTNYEEEKPESNDSTSNASDDTSNDDNEDVEASEDSQKKQEDKYLYIFRKSSVRRRLRKVLGNISSKSEEQIAEYLKNDYFNSNDAIWFDYEETYGYNGYVNLFKAMRSEYDGEAYKDDLKNEIIKNIYEIKDSFMNYIYENVSCTTSSTSLGYSDAGDIIKGEPVVKLKDTESTETDISSEKSLYGTDTNPLPFGRYIMGVVYAEIGSGINNENTAKAQMIAAKSFTLGRTQNSAGKGSVGMRRKYDTTDTQTIFYMRANVNDQDFCDVYEGCQSGTYAWSNRTIMKGSGDAKPALSQEQISNLEKWWNETVSEYIFDDKNKVFAGMYYNNYNENCIKGSCMAQSELKKAPNGTDYETLLYKYAYTEDKFIKYNAEEGTLFSVASNCTSVSTSVCGIDESNFVYYDQKDYSNGFCGSSSVTIKDAGCGVTSMAMVVSNLTNTTLTPLQTNEEATSKGNCSPDSGTYVSYFSNASSTYGITYKNLSKDANGINAAKETLNNGGLVIANVGPASPFTTGGHYVVIRGIGSDDKVYVADPNHHELFNTAYDLSDFINKGWVTNGWYGFTSDKSSEIKEKYCNVKGKATGYLGNPLDPNDTSTTYTNNPSAKCFPHYCSGGPHSGFDLNSGNTGGKAKEGDPVYAMDGGVVKKVGSYSKNCYKSCAEKNSAGLGITISHDNGYSTAYYHFSKRPDNIKAGTKVAKGELIGYVGNTGNSSGTHLHITLQNDSLYSKYGWSGARGYSDRGFMNAANYININKTYVGQTK